MESNASKTLIIPQLTRLRTRRDTVYPKKYAHGFCFAVLCCGYTLTDFPISTRLTSLALWQSSDCPSASKATLMNMDKYFMWIHYERLHNHTKAKHNETVCIFLGIYCRSNMSHKICPIVFGRCQFWPSCMVIACAYVCVCLLVELVRTIPDHSFKLKSPKLDQRWKTPWLSFVSFWGSVPDLQGQFDLKAN